MVFLCLCMFLIQLFQYMSLNLLCHNLWDLCTVYIKILKAFYLYYMLLLFKIYLKKTILMYSRIYLFYFFVKRTTDIFFCEVSFYHVFPFWNVCNFNKILYIMQFKAIFLLNIIMYIFSIVQICALWVFT
jgi:hypothetical protein